MEREAELVVGGLSGGDVAAPFDERDAERPAIELEVEPETALDEGVGPEVPVRIDLQGKVPPDLDRKRALEKVDGRRFGHPGAGVERSGDLDEIRIAHRRLAGVAQPDDRRDAGGGDRRVGRGRLETVSLDVIARFVMKPQPPSWLLRQVAGDFP